MKKLLIAMGALTGLGVQPLFACAACYGQSDSPLASGLNWGIFFLMGVIGTVLSGVVVFFVHVGKNSAGLDQLPAPEKSPEAPK
jgi:hypothetical protein